MKLLTVRYARERGDQRLLGAVTLLQDITHLREIDRLKSEFIATASHELRTPLTSVQMGVNLLLEQAAGGLYLFDSEEHARAWGDDMLHASLGHMPGVSDIETRYYDVDERLSAITRGPLAVAAT